MYQIKEQNLRILVADIKLFKAKREKIFMFLVKNNGEFLLLCVFRITNIWRKNTDEKELYFYTGKRKKFLSKNKAEYFVAYFLLF